MSPKTVSQHSCSTEADPNIQLQLYKAQLALTISRARYFLSYFHMLPYASKAKYDNNIVIYRAAY